jgi:hypothetical protein
VCCRLVTSGLEVITEETKCILMSCHILMIAPETCEYVITFKCVVTTLTIKIALMEKLRAD